MTPARRTIALLQSTPVRLALGLVVIFAVTMTMTFAGAYFYVRNSLLTSIAANLEQQIGGFRAAADSRAAAALVQAEARAADPERRIVAYVRPDGRVVGNVGLRINAATIELAQSDDDRLGRDGYTLRRVPLRGGILVVGESLEPLADLKEIFARLLVLGMLPTILIALLSAGILAGRSARRVGEIEAALDELSRGNLAARAPAANGVTDLDRIARSLNKAAAAQEAASAALHQVSADIAHDLKTPVQRIGVLLNRLRERLGEDDGQAAVLADQAREEAGRAVAVFQSLLQIAQIESGGPKPRLAPVSLRAAMRAVVDLYEPVAEDSGHGLRLSDDVEGSDTIIGEPVLLRQAIANLIENALRHTPAGTEIDVALTRAAGRCTLTVSDDGPGIPAAERDKVLQRFYRVETSRTTPGNGLGFSLVAAIVALHDGSLTLLDNTPGLKVVMTFPAEQPD